MSELVEIRIKPCTGNPTDGPDSPKFQLSIDDGFTTVHKWMTMQNLINLEGLCAKLRLDYEVGDAPKEMGDHTCARAFAKFIVLRYKDPEALKHLRLGQHFCNLFIKNPWPELYNERDLGRATALIAQWLQDNQYYDELPPILNGDSK